MIQGISHITLVVRDLKRSSKLFMDIFNAEIVYESGDKTFSFSREVFLLVGGLWIALMEGDALAGRSYNHVAFQVLEKDFPEYLRRIEQSGVEIKKGRSRIEGEGRSVYFYDYDNHLFELHTGTLDAYTRG